MDDASLTAACRGSHTVINCAAPSSVIVDRVAKAAFSVGAHYVDPGGDDRLFDRLMARQAEISSQGLVCLLGAGYVPGLSEIIVRAIYDVHRGQTTDPCKVRLFVVDRNEWSLSGFVDIVDRLCRNPPEVGVYRHGTFQPRSMLTAWMRRRLPDQSRPEMLMPVRWSEIDEFIAEARPLEAAVYLPIDLTVYFICRFFARVAPTRIDLAARVAKAAFSLKARRQGAGGVLYAEAAGRFNRQPLRWYIEIPEGRHYERTGQIGALATALVADGSIAEPGVRYLAHAVDPHDFIVRLRVWGVETVDVDVGRGGSESDVR
jgi:hypothetical protein